MSTPFPFFHIEDEDTGEVIWIYSASYACAALFASLYVLWRADLRTFLRAFPMHIVFIGLMTMCPLAASLLPNVAAIVTTAISVIVLAAVQSRIMIRRLCRYYARNGWTITRY